MKKKKKYNVSCYYEYGVGSVIEHSPCNELTKKIIHSLAEFGSTVDAQGYDGGDYETYVDEFLKIVKNEKEKTRRKLLKKLNK